MPKCKQNLECFKNYIVSNSALANYGQQLKTYMQAYQTCNTKPDGNVNFEIQVIMQAHCTIRTEYWRTQNQLPTLYNSKQRAQAAQELVFFQRLEHKATIRQLDCQ